jgi:hypothetical protein
MTFLRAQAIKYLSEHYHPPQTPEGITKLVKELEPFELAKAEKLQIVNLAPTEPVELYVVSSAFTSIKATGALTTMR